MQVRGYVAISVTVDPRAASAFGPRAEAYERSRPSYPGALVAHIARELGVTAASTVVDLGAGTGKLTRVVAPLAGRTIAVDPARGMLEELERRVPGVETVVGTAEALPLPDASVDAVFAGEAFHWFRTTEAAREIARVLMPGGGLVLVWNRERWNERYDWVGAMDAMLEPYRRAAGDFPSGGPERWRPALEATGLFEPLSHAVGEHEHRVRADDFLALVGSWSWIANLPGRRRDHVLARVRALMGTDAELTLHYRTEIHWTRSKT